MQNDADMRSWSWHPAENPARQVGRTAGAVVLGIACVLIGVGIGRLSISRTDSKSSVPPAHGAVTAPAPSKSAKKADSPAPNAPPEAAPSLALSGSVGDEQQPSVPPAEAAAPVVLLNPNSGAEPAPRLQRETKKGVGGQREKRALAKSRAPANSRSAGVRANATRSGPTTPSSTRNYLALRDYVLGE